MMKLRFTFVSIAKEREGFYQRYSSLSLLFFLLIAFFNGSARVALAQQPPTENGAALYHDLAQWRLAKTITPLEIGKAVAALKDKEPMVRTAALELLLDAQAQNNPALSPATIAVLGEMVRSDTVSGVRGTAAAVLAAAGKEAENTVRELLLGPDLRVRQTMATAVRAQGEVSASLRDAVEWASPPYALAGPTLHPNSGFEAGLSGWKLTQENGATGEAVSDETFFRTGRRSLRLHKTNGRGYLQLRSTFPLVLPPSTSIVTWRGWFHSDDAPLTALMLFRLRDEAGKIVTADIEQGARAWQSQTFLRNSPSGVWERRLLMIKPSTQSRRYYMEVVLYGNPCTVWLDDLDFPAAPHDFPISDPVPSLPQPATAAAEKAGPMAADVTVKAQNGRSQLAIAGKPTPPVLHMPFVPETGDFRAFDAAGVPLQTVIVEFNDNTGSFTPGGSGRTGVQPVWPSAAREEYHFEEPLRRLERVARQAPHSRLIVGFHLLWPRDYVATHPGTEWMNPQGEKGYGNWLYFYGFAKELKSGTNWWPSPYLDKPLEDAGRVIQAFNARLKQMPFADRIAGFFISGGHDGQFYIKERDYSPAARVAWQQWLREKYGTDAALAAAWQRPGLTFEKVEVPLERQSHQITKDYSPIFYDPAREADQRDYEEFRTARMWQVKERLAAYAKESWGRPTIALTWNMGGALIENMQPFLDSKALDACIVQPTYQYRPPGFVGGNAAAYDSLAQRGKLVVKELDLRTWIRETYGNEMRSMQIGTPLSLDDFKAVFRKEAGQMIAEDQGWWYFDISSNAFRHPGIMEEIARAQQLYTELQQKPRDFHPEVAIVYTNPAAMWSRTTHYGFRKIAQWVLDYQEMALKASGVPVARFYLDDFLQQADLSRYKTVVFLNAYVLNETQRRLIREKLQNGGRTLVWHYAAGYLDEKQMNVSSISEIVGMKIATSFDLKPQRAYAVASSDPLAKGLLPLQGMSDIYRTQFGTDDTQHAYDAQRFAVDDPAAIPLARYGEDNRTAIAVRRLNGWNSVFVGPLGGLSSELLSNIAQNSGAFTATAPGGLVLEMNDRFISAHGLRTGQYKIQLPRAATIVDYDSNEVLAAKAREFTLPLQAQQTRWLKLQ